MWHSFQLIISATAVQLNISQIAEKTISKSKGPGMLYLSGKICLSTLEIVYLLRGVVAQWLERRFDTWTT